ncbi:MAG: hypothetical protein H7A23_21365 [Leptospiraceae bacterium]|nr:hypothetical protein [Leptospiraceae bacterium]MCP5497112.1 hypothetical protein [Leptospiraceae bacterium]
MKYYSVFFIGFYFLVFTFTFAQGQKQSPRKPLASPCTVAKPNSQNTTQNQGQASSNSTIKNPHYNKNHNYRYYNSHNQNRKPQPWYVPKVFTVPNN